MFPFSIAASIVVEFLIAQTVLDPKERFVPRTASGAKVLLKNKASCHELGKCVFFQNKQVGHFTE